VTALYDKIGGTYSAGRRSDPRIAAAIERAVAGCDSILNVGAGTGSYEPSSRFVVAVEPSRTMIGQRPLGAAPVVQGCAEALPFADCSFEAVLGILTVHHWKDQGRGLSDIARFEHALGSLETIVVAVPADCRDGFLGAYWKRPNAYLDPVVRKNISTFSKIGNIDSQLARLENDIVSGAWERRYDTLMGLEVLDLGYRILISHVARRL
jgi:ubiquinone/menaquinone biosynthesis C-methylase UbiE